VTLQTSSVITLTIVACIFFFTSSLSGSFLTVYYNRELGLSIPVIIEILLFTFPLIGLLPIVLLKEVKSFERLISFGIFFTLVFYVILNLVRSPAILGTLYGLSQATFWPSYNLLQFRLAGSHARARIVGLFTSIIPSLTSIAGPAVGGFIIQNMGFGTLFVTSAVLYLISLTLSLRIHLQPETCKFSIPRTKSFAIFFGTFILRGLSEAYWIAYPLFVLGISGTVFNMGIVLTLNAVMICAVTFLVSWVSDIKRMRVSFAVIGALLNASWFFALPFVSTTYEIVALSLLSGLASAFSMSWFAHYGDTFAKDYYASILVLMETGLMIGRMGNLAPTYVFLGRADYASYFILLGVILLFSVPLYVAAKKEE
jgi:MFS family permease